MRAARQPRNPTGKHELKSVDKTGRVAIAAGKDKIDCLGHGREEPGRGSLPSVANGDAGAVTLTGDGNGGFFHGVFLVLFFGFNCPRQAIRHCPETINFIGYSGYFPAINSGLIDSVFMRQDLEKAHGRSG